LEFDGSDEELISVLIPAYNAERFIEEALRSVSRQTHANLEIIVVDDGSTDRTLEILERYAGIEPRLTVLKQSHGGVSAARNTGLRQAKGSLVAQIDADDIMKPERLAIQAAFLKHNPALSFCGSGMDFINEAGEVVGGFTLKLHDLNDLGYMLRHRRQFSFTHGTVMYRKAAVEAVGGYQSEFDAAEDLHLFLRMLSAGYLGISLPERLLQYRLHLNGISGSQTRRQVQLRDFLFHNFYAERDRRESVDFETFRRRGSKLSRAYGRWREEADILHSKARYRRVMGWHLRGTAMMMVAIAMKAERFPPRVVRKLLHRVRVSGTGRFGRDIPPAAI